MKRIILFSPTGYVGSMIKKSFMEIKDVELTEITRGSRLDKIHGNYDTIIYSASVSSAESLKFIEDNVLSVITIMDFCKKHCVKRVIYLSTDSIYGELNTEEVSEKAVMVNPDFYGVTKYLAEKIIIESGIPYYILRMPGIVGKVWRNTYLYRLIDQFYKNESITVYNSNKLFNNVLDIDDLVHFILLLCDLQKSGDKIFLLGNTEKVELIKVVNYIKNCCQSSSEIKIKNTNDKRYFTLNVRKAVEYGYSSKSIWDIIRELCVLKNESDRRNVM